MEMFWHAALAVNEAIPSLFNPVAVMGLKGLSLSCPWNLVQLGSFGSD